MQVISSYKDNVGDVRLVQQFRLYNFENPWIKQWRRARRTGNLPFDLYDRCVLDNLDNRTLVTVDSAGYYFKHANVDVVCIESSFIGGCYCQDCYIEPDILSHRPSYVESNNVVFFKFPWFLKYATLDDFTNFLTTWAKSTMIVAFNPVLIQHNHLKFDLLELVTQQTSLNIQRKQKDLWIITP